MKRYIFLTPAVGNMGGSQMYVCNKCDYLKANGWIVNVFFYHNYDIILDSLKEFEGNHIGDLLYRFNYVPGFIRKKILNRIISGVSQEDEVVIESHTCSLGEWAELAAQLVQGTHILNFLEENVGNTTKSQATFYEFKLKRWECLNASQLSLQRLFGDYFKEDYLSYMNVMVPLCSNVTSNADYSYEFAESDYNIMSIGRLDKPYVNSMINDVVNFITNNQNKLFNFIVVGASPDGRTEEYINSRFEKLSNANVYCLGYMFPIPSTLIKKADVSIASSNSVRVSADLGVPTIPVSADDFQALGVFGSTTTRTFKRVDEPVISIPDLLTELLINNVKYDSTIIESESDLNTVFEPQIHFLANHSRKEEYFDVKSIYSRFSSVISTLKYLIHKILK